MSEAIALREADALPVWNPKQVVAQVNLIQEVMRDVMHKDEHYGTIPGTNKPTLLKPGAEKLCLTFRLAPTYDITERDLGSGHREYRITCRLTSIQTGAVIGDGVGICSTMESKYRYRHAEAEDTGAPIPSGYWDAKKQNAIAKMQELLGGKGYAARKTKDGRWTIHKLAEEKVENPDIADVYNTVLKMAKKRAMVDAAITATGASDIFTQDLEETAAPDQPKDVTPPPAPPAEPTKAVDPWPTTTSHAPQARQDALELTIEAEAVQPGPSPVEVACLEWTGELEAAADMPKLQALWKSLSVTKTWGQFSPEQQARMTAAKDKRKAALVGTT